MSRKINVAGYSTHSDLYKMVPEKLIDDDSQIIEKLEVLNISEFRASSNSYRTIPGEVGAQYDSLSNTCLEEVVVENLVCQKGSKTIPEKAKDDEIPTGSIPDDTQTRENVDEFPFPPILYRKKLKKGDKDEFGSLTLLETPKKDEADYNSDETGDIYVECGEKGLCKCRKMRGRNYYEYYIQTKDKDDYTMYPKGKCVLPRGTVLHFTEAPDTLKREDIDKALVALGAKIEFLDYQSGSKEGWARLSYPYEARAVIKKMTDQKLNIAKADLVFRVLSGKEEKRYLLKAIEGIFKLQQKAKGLNKQLKKAGYEYVSKLDSDFKPF